MEVEHRAARPVEDDLTDFAQLLIERPAADKVLFLASAGAQPGQEKPFVVAPRNRHMRHSPRPLLGDSSVIRGEASAHDPLRQRSKAPHIFGTPRIG